MTRDDIVGSYAEQERAQRERAPLDLPNVAKLADGYTEDEITRNSALVRAVAYLTELRDVYIAADRREDVAGVGHVMRTLLAMRDEAEARRARRDAESEPAELPSGLLAGISEGELVIFCQWYALCDHVAVGTTSHPILGDVPICQRCADKHALPVDPFGAQP